MDSCKSSAVGGEALLYGLDEMRFGMAYVPDWQLIADAWHRVVETGTAEKEAKQQLCAAIADGKIAVRLTLAADPGGAVPAQQITTGLSPPVGFSPKDIEWSNSRPTREWQSPMQAVGEPISLFINRAYHLIGRTIELVEVYTPDVQRLFATSRDLGDSPTSAGSANPRHPVGIEVEFRRSS